MKFSSYLFAFLFLSFFNINSFSQSHWESLIIQNDIFAYYPSNIAPLPSWNTVNFNDQEWQKGMGGIGYGDNDDVTIINETKSLYLRKIISSPQNITTQNLSLYINYDDGFVAYMNGVEICRSSNLTDETPNANSQLSEDHEITDSYEKFILNNITLNEGDNIFALHVINMSSTSSDLSSNVNLLAEIQGTDTLFNSTPEWFVAPGNFYMESNLPLFIINNDGLEIPDDPRAIAQLKVINNKTGINRTDDSLSYNGRISIETRGSSSQYFFPKKSYAFETQTDEGENNNVKLLGLPKENDWILYAPYSDKTMMRNALAYYLGNKTGRWSPNTRFCEVIVNDEYMGIYLLTEKIKIDNKRVDIASLDEDDNAGDSITGGYILKVDRGDDFWYSPHKVDGKEVEINYHHPKKEDLTQQQQQYIKKYITRFEDNLANINFNNPQTGYRSYINVESFIDFYLLNEFSRNVDAYILSTFLYKDKNSKDHRITMGPFWDYNLAYGNANYRSGINPNGWIVPANRPTPFWFKRLLEDPYYKSELRLRWEEIRSEWLNEASIFHFMDSVSNHLSEARVRNYEKWPIIGEYVWPNEFIGNSYEDEISFMKNWISDRFEWMDTQISKFEIIDQPWTTVGLEKFAAPNLNLYPNPFKEHLTATFALSQKHELRLELVNTTGKLLYKHIEQLDQGKHTIKINSSDLMNHTGLVIYRLYLDDHESGRGKIIRSN